MIVGDYCDTDEEKEAAGGFTTVFLSTGLAVGSVLSYLLVLVVNYISYPLAIPFLPSSTNAPAAFSSSV